MCETYVPSDKKRKKTRSINVLPQKQVFDGNCWKTVFWAFIEVLKNYHVKCEGSSKKAVSHVDYDSFTYVLSGSIISKVFGEESCIKCELGKIILSAVQDSRIQNIIHGRFCVRSEVAAKDTLRLIKPGIDNIYTFDFDSSSGCIVFFFCGKPFYPELLGSKAINLKICK
jgi:hypothetical protein